MSVERRFSLIGHVHAPAGGGGGLDGASQETITGSWIFKDSLFIEELAGSDRVTLRYTGSELRFTSGDVADVGYDFRDSANSSKVLIRVDGSERLRLRGETATGNALIAFYPDVGVIRQSFIGQNSASNILLIRNETASAHVSIEGALSGGGNTNLIICDPDDSISLWHAGLQTVRTLPAASGGLEINNTLNGGGFEQVMTEQSSGTFQAQGIGGFSSNPIINFSYRVRGHKVTLTCRSSSLVGISNAITFTFSGLPNNVRPNNVSAISTASKCINSSGSIGGFMTITPAGVVTMLTTTSGGAWTAAGNKGIDDGATFTYYKDGD